MSAATRVLIGDRSLSVRAVLRRLLSEATAIEIQEREDGERFPQTHQMLGLIAAQRGQFEAAAKSYRRYLELAPQAGSAEAIRKQLNEWEVLGVIEAAEVAGTQE